MIRGMLPARSNGLKDEGVIAIETHSEGGNTVRYRKVGSTGYTCGVPRRDCSIAPQPAPWSNVELLCGWMAKPS